MPKPKRIALVIGNSEYNPGYLPNPARDAALITQRLKALRYEVVGGASSMACPTGLTGGQDCDFGKTFGLLATFLDKIEPGATAIIYYAGHALQVADRNFLMPVKADLGGENPLIHLVDLRSSILKAAERAGRDGTVAVFIDACRNNPFTPDEMRTINENCVRAIQLGIVQLADQDSHDPEHEPEPGGNTRGLTTMGIKRTYNTARTFIGFATAPGDVAYDGKKGSLNSPFSTSLDKHLQTRGLEIEELYNRVQKDVIDEVESALGRYQDPWSESNLNTPFYLHPRSPVPIVVLGLAGLLAGLAISWAIFEKGWLTTTPQPWMWGLGLLFGLVAAGGTLQWGSGRWLDALLAFLGPGFGFALGFAVLQLIPQMPDNLAEVAPTPASLAAANAYWAITIAGGALYLFSTVMVWVESPPPPARTFLQVLNRALSWLLPIIIVAVLLRLEHYVSRTNPIYTNIALFTVLAGVIYATSVALACRAQRGLFSQSGPFTGAVSVGLMKAGLFAIYAVVGYRRGLSPEQANLLLIWLGGAWHMLLGAQLGYCFAYYVPDYRSRTT